MATIITIGGKKAMSQDDIENENTLDIVAEVEKKLVRAKLDEKEELQKASGLAGDTAKGQGSALHKIITISEETRQILAMANFKDDAQAENVAAALIEADRYGCTPNMILDWVVAHCGVASQHMSKTQWGVQALTHLEINQPNQNKFSWRGKPKDNKPV